MCYIFRVPETVFSDKQDMLGEVFVDTMDTVSFNWILTKKITTSDGFLSEYHFKLSCG